MPLLESVKAKFAEYPFHALGCIRGAPDQELRVRKLLDDRLAVVEIDVVVFFGYDLVCASTAPDSVRSVNRLIRHGVDVVISCSAAHEIRALIALHVVGAVLTVELVVAAIPVQRVLGWPWVRSAMKLIAGAGTI